MDLHIDGSWRGWWGDTIVQLSDGSVWRQDEYYYQYRADRHPKVSFEDDKLMVEGMRRAVRVRPLL